MIPNDVEDLVRFGDRLANGIGTHRSEFGIGEEWAGQMRSKLERLRQAVTSYATAGSTYALATSRLSLADKSLRMWLTKARLVVLLARGARGSESWSQNNFANRKIKIPKRFGDRIDLARALVSFFARHPEFSVSFAEVTAARGRAIYERVGQSWEILQLAEADFASLKRERDAAARDVRKVCRAIIIQSGARLSVTDPRWCDLIGDLDETNRHEDQIQSPAIRFLPNPNPDAHDVVAA
jgi:hypothetical protein